MIHRLLHRFAWFDGDSTPGGNRTGDDDQQADDQARQADRDEAWPRRAGHDPTQNREGDGCRTDTDTKSDAGQAQAGTHDGADYSGGGGTQRALSS